jgi:hypothetical protein
MRVIVENRTFISFLLACACGLTLFYGMPSPQNDVVLKMIAVERPGIFTGIQWLYTGMLFTTPYFLSSVLLSFGYVFLLRCRKKRSPSKLPPYPAIGERGQLSVVIGELHHPRKRIPAEEPKWLMIPSRGLFTGIAIFGAIGGGKTSGCMYPFAEQVLAYRANDPEKRAAALVLEVKGDFCYKVRQLLAHHGREEDYVEIATDNSYRYNPLHNDLAPYALAYGLATMLNNLFGKGKEPFWQQAYTNMIKFIILLHKVLYDYVTLFDLYECAINPPLLQKKIRDGARLFAKHKVLIGLDAYLENPGLDAFGVELDEQIQKHVAEYSEALEAFLRENGIEYELLTESDPNIPENNRKRAEFEAVKRWFEHDWMRIEPKLRTSIVEGISVFLSLFDDDPSIKQTFCPAKECYDRVLNKEEKFGIPLPPFGQMIETGKVVALNFPVAANPGLARIIGTLIKQDFQRAMLMRIPAMERQKSRHFREVLFLCDEYQSFATCGESDPSGDEKFFALSRQAKCIPIVATQSISSLKSTLQGESWRTLLQTFRTKVFLSMTDDFSEDYAAKLCGKEEQLKLNYTISENVHDAKVSMLTGRSMAGRASISASKSYNLQRDFVFEPKIFNELVNYQAVVLAYDGTNPFPPTFCYLKPYYLDPNIGYFEQLEQGMLA